jgi:hypothetical protein
MSANYVVESYGRVLYRRWWNTAPGQRYSTVEDTWRLGPFELHRRYLLDDPKYGDWTFGMTLAWRRWLGPWLTFSFGNGAQNFDSDERWWKEGEE